jgi:hypothetical protein
MASSRLPGPICTSRQPPVDSRTLQLADTPPPGPADASAGAPRLDPIDVESLELFEKSLKRRSLEELQYLRTQNEQLYNQAVREFGPRSKSAIFLASAIALIDNYIAVSGSAYGEAKKRLEDLTDALKNGAPVKDDDFRKAVGDLLAIEKQKQLLGIDDGNAETMSAIVEAHNALAEVKVKQFKALMQKAKQPGTNVTMEQISKELQGLLGLEREAQLLGIDKQNSETMSLMVEAHNTVSEIKTKQFKELLEKAKQPGSNVTEEQMSKEVGVLLSLEREDQLLGIHQGNTETMSLVTSALNVVHERRKSALSDLIKKAKSGNSQVIKQQMRDQAVKVQESERQCQLMGVSDRETGELLEEARRILSSSTVEVTIGEVTLDKRN